MYYLKYLNNLLEKEKLFGLNKNKEEVKKEKII